MKRSQSVTLAAVVMLVASSAFVIFVMWLIRKEWLVTGNLASNNSFANLFVAYLVLGLGIGLWGIAASIGLLRLKNWARVSVLVMSALAIFFAVCGALGLMVVPILLSQNPGIPAAAVKMVVTVGVAMLLVPLAIAIWWVILFTRKRVRLEFATRGAAVVSSAIPGAAPALDPAPGFAPAFAAAPGRG